MRYFRVLKFHFGFVLVFFYNKATTGVNIYIIFANVRVFINIYELFVNDISRF